MNTNELMIIDPTNIKNKIYEIRGQKVMLDFELAEIYGYETKNFNRQINNNIVKFPPDFMFRLNSEEFNDILRCKNFTSSWGGKRYLPYAFTEQGIYMLMSVLRGELAVQQSIQIIRVFKQMKDYLVESGQLVLNTNSYLETKFALQEARLYSVESRLDILMNAFKEPDALSHLLILDGERIDASVAYEQIFSSAKKSVLLIDDYISVKTLQRLKACSKDIEITLITDNKSKNKVTNGDINDFMSDTGIDIRLISSNGRFHDRYIVLDYKNESEIIYHTGSSSKDAGNKISTITKLDDVSVYHPLLDELLNK